jgi:hypothetical protein
MNLDLLEEEVLKKIEQADLNTALELVKNFVTIVANDPHGVATVFGSERLDRLCLAIGQAIGGNTKRSTAADEESEKKGEYVVTIATELGQYGGHTRVIEDVIKAQAEKSHIVLLTDLFNRADINSMTDWFRPIAELRVAPRGTMLKKLEWLVAQLDAIKPARIFLFNHHQDAIAIASVQPWLGSTKVIFYHHADHNLCLGVHLPRTLHIDPHNIGYHNCRMHEGLKDNRYLPLVIEDKAPHSANHGFLRDGILRTCSSGTYLKFNPSYMYPYGELILKRLELRNGVHFHIGNLPDGVLGSIRNRLVAEGIDASRFIHIPWVQSLFSSLIEHHIDLYISSFPLGGGRASIEAMGSGTPSLIHQSSVSRHNGFIDSAYPEALVWKDPAEFYDQICSLTPQVLTEHSGYARQHYESYHLPSLMASELNNICAGKGTLEPLPLKPYEPDYLQRYLHFRAMALNDRKFQLMVDFRSWNTAPLRWVRDFIFRLTGRRG